MSLKHLKSGDQVIKLPLDNAIKATAVKIESIQGRFVICDDGNKYSVITGVLAGKSVLGKKDMIVPVPFGISINEEIERLRNLAIRAQEDEQAQEIILANARNKEAKQRRKEKLASFKENKKLWSKAKKIDTALGKGRVVNLTHDGQYCGDIVRKTILVIVLQDKILDGSNMVDGYKAHGLCVYKILFNNQEIDKTSTIIGSGLTDKEAIGEIFSKISGLS